MDEQSTTDESRKPQDGKGRDSTDGDECDYVSEFNVRISYNVLAELCNLEPSLLPSLKGGLNVLNSLLVEFAEPSQ